jgi:hypothetical protein
MSSKAPIVVTILLSICAITGLSLSSYNLGIYRTDRASDAYQISSAFTAVSATLTIVSIIILIVLVAQFSSSPEYPPIGPY